MSKKSYKEPVFLFTSSSMRQAAWAGWYSALGDEENAEKFIHSAYAAWGKEIAAGRRFDFSDRFNSDIYYKIDFERLKALTDKYLRDMNNEIKKAKVNDGKQKNSDV
ncbi:MAG: hypothetical protein C0412_05550 [Flavobacterium sp.]|nr:hypothetical protein [Flavobacterium sp.]